MDALYSCQFRYLPRIVVLKRSFAQLYRIATVHGVVWQWWCCTPADWHTLALPSLYEVALKTLAVPATSALVERVFSCSGLFMQPQITSDRQDWLGVHEVQLKQIVIAAPLTKRWRYYVCVGVTVEIVLLIHFHLSVSNCLWNNSDAVSLWLNSRWDQWRI